MQAAQAKFREILAECEKIQASDIHITSGVSPYMRIRNEVKSVSEEVLTPFVVEQMAMALMTESQREVFSQKLSIDFAFFAESGVRYRANVFRQRGTVAMALRRLDNEFRSWDDLTLPPQMEELSKFLHGLVLVTGPTGSGKSTTLATIIHQINMTRHCHIITIEDPLEFIHDNLKSLVRQRELYSDVLTFSDAIRAALREDPDVLLVGEMRDVATIRAAIIAAETGHLVLSTLHTNDVVSSVSRIVAVFPAEEQESVRNQLSRALRAVVSQRLVHRSGNQGRVPAVEIMRVNSAISNLIRTGELQQIYSVMQTGNNEGMLLLEQSLAALLAHNVISREDAIRYSRDTNVLERRLRHIQELRTAV
jgi:twitching motility protein PilT